MPGSEFTLARTARRDNTSGYFYNDKKVTREEVVVLLKGRGIDLDNNRFLILQGEVEQIATMPPKGKVDGDVGMLEYLEDIIGTASFASSIEKAYKDYETANENRIEKLHRVKFVQGPLYIPIPRPNLNPNPT